MAHYDEIQILASDCHGYFTAAAARKAGIKSFELDRWMKIGRLEKPARGVYRVANYPPSAIEPYALAVLATGARAAIYGESVLGMLNLIPSTVISLDFELELPEEGADSGTGSLFLPTVEDYQDVIWEVEL